MTSRTGPPAFLATLLLAVSGCNSDSEDICPNGFHNDERFARCMTSCANVDCGYNGHCVPLTDSTYVCECDAGTEWIGGSCRIPCQPNPCGRHSICAFENGVEECRCNAGFELVEGLCAPVCVIDFCPSDGMCVGDQCMDACLDQCPESSVCDAAMKRCLDPCQFEGAECRIGGIDGKCLWNGEHTECLMPQAPLDGSRKWIIELNPAQETHLLPDRPWAGGLTAFFWPTPQQSLLVALEGRYSLLLELVPSGEETFQGRLGILKDRDQLHQWVTTWTGLRWDDYGRMRLPADRFQMESNLGTLAFNDAEIEVVANPPTPRPRFRFGGIMCMDRESISWVLDMFEPADLLYVFHLSGKDICLELDLVELQGVQTAVNFK